MFHANISSVGHPPPDGCGYIASSFHTRTSLYGSRVPFEELLTTRTYLYTRIAAGLESAEIEHWFGHEYETPAEEALQKATSNGRLTPSDWRVLVRFLAAQDVRTPARLLETLERWRKTLPDLLKNTLQASVQKFEVMKSRGENIPPTESPLTKYFPLRIKTETEPNQEFGTLRAETIAGRGLSASPI